MSDTRPIIISVNISPGGIPKLPIDAGPVTTDGITGDGHEHEKHVTPIQAICLIDEEDLADLRAEGYDVAPGTMGENLTVRGLEVDDLKAGARLRLSGGVELEYTKPRGPCFVLDSISPRLKEVVKGRCGGYAKVITPGEIRPGETIDVEHDCSKPT